MKLQKGFLTKTTKKNLLLFVIAVAIPSVSCRNLSPLVTTIRAEDPKINFELSQDGHIDNDESIISPDATKIYFEFFLDVPENTEVSLNFIWYYENQLIKTHYNKHPRGNVIVTLERDPSIIPEFQKGVYRVEVWFLNTMIISKKFEVKN